MPREPTAFWRRRSAQRGAGAGMWKRLPGNASDPHQVEGLAFGGDVGLLLRVELEPGRALPSPPALAPSHGRTCFQKRARSNFSPASRRHTSIPWRVAIQAAIPPEAPLPTTTTEWTAGFVDHFHPVLR